MKVYRIDKKNGVEIQKISCTADMPEPPHTHDFIELVYTRSGEGTHYINGAPYKVRHGDLLFINYGEVHSIETDGELLFYNFLMMPEFISENLANTYTVDDLFLLFLPDNEELPVDRPPLVHFSGDTRLELDDMAERMFRESVDKKTGYQSVLNGYMRLVFAKLIRELLTDVGENRPKLLTGEILSYLDENYREPLTVNFLSDLFFYNPAYLGRAFKAVYGVSIREYLTEKRLEYAARLLSERENKMSVEEISASAGYADKTQFYRAFREKYGMSPGEYSRKNS